MMNRKRIAVVGAGASGLPAVRHAILYENVDVTCFEASNHVGGLWRYKPEETKESSVMKSTIINTSKEMTAYSDFPPEPSMANFMHNTEMYRYLNNYADHFGLRDFIKFNHKVLMVERSTTYADDGTWNVTYLDQDGREHSEVFDGVMMCSGHHAIPHIPEPWPGQEKFKGRVIHSHSYKDHKGFEDRVVVVVGIGNSGSDVAVELSRIAKNVYLVTRRGTWVFNRIFDYGKPFDMALTKRSSYLARQLFPEWVSNWVMESQLNRRFDHEQYGLKPKHRVFGAHPTINDELPNRIASGTVVIRKNIKQFVGDQGIVLLNETTEGKNEEELIEHLDDLILSTGYSFEFGMIEGGTLFPVEDNQVDFFKNMFPLQTSDHNTLGIIGLVQPNGSIMPIAEMQARVFLENLCGKQSLPSPAVMKRDIDAKREANEKKYVNSRRHTIQVDYIGYMGELSQLISCYPSMTRIFCKSPLLAWTVFNGAAVPYHYRLFGTNSWNGAREAIEKADERTFKATSSAQYRPSSNGGQFMFGVLLVSMCAALVFSCLTMSFSS